MKQTHTERKNQNESIVSVQMEQREHKLDRGLWHSNKCNDNGNENEVK